MRTALLLSCMVVCAADTFAQTPSARSGQPAASTQPAQTAAPGPAPAQAPAQVPAPAPAQPAQPRATTPAPAGRGAAQPPAAAKSGVAMTVMDMRGTTLDGVHVVLSGPAMRADDTAGGGLVNFPSLPTGTYRLTFTGDAVTAFEREVTLTAGKVVGLEINLSPAPPPKEVVKMVEVPVPAPTPPTPAPAPAMGPTGQPLTAFIPDVLEKEFVGRDPRRSTILSCSGSMRTMMVQLNDPQPERIYETADAIYYAMGGEGVVRLNNKDVQLKTNGFVSVPRGTMHSVARKGNRPLVLLFVLSGEPCEEGK